MSRKTTQVSRLVHEAFNGLDATSSRNQPRLLQVLRTFSISMAVWMLVGLVFMGQAITRSLFYGDPSLWQEVGFWTMRVVLSATLTLVVLWLGTILPLEKRIWVRRIALHV